MNSTAEPREKRGDYLIACAALENIVSLAAFEDVVSGATEQFVGCGLAADEDGVVFRLVGDRAAGGGPEDHVENEGGIVEGRHALKVDGDPVLAEGDVVGFQSDDIGLEGDADDRRDRVVQVLEDGAVELRGDVLLADGVTGFPENRLVEIEADRGVGHGHLEELGAA
ncbi:hypothetical protein ASC96_13055 [Rhizobium sp. Root1204]|nr:hypothetical protein ASC96_13055 [Rhizobium sp. Root1204]